jgi:lipoate-protein ligase A
MIGGRKVSGTAQARGKEWFFQQGAIILDWRREEWERVFPELTAESPVLDGLAQYQPSLDLDRLEAAITEAFIQNGLEFEEIPGLKQATLGKADS